MLANYECDLHGHTNRSDGADSPKEFIDHAVERGLKVAAITDHDIKPPVWIEVDGKKVSSVDYARSKGLKLILGIEISCETYVDDTHLVCFGCDWNDPYFEELAQFTADSKINGYKELVEYLNRNNMPLTWQEVLENNGHPVTEENVQKKMIFELMARRGYMESWSQAKIFVKNNIQIKRKKPDAVSVIQKIHELGGIVIAAHPYLISEPVEYEGEKISRSQYLDRLIEAGLDGIEARYTYDKTSYGGNLTKQEIYDNIIKDYAGKGLIISGGSDYHNDGKKGVKNPREIGECGLTMEEYQSQERLARL